MFKDWEATPARSLRVKGGKKMPIDPRVYKVIEMLRKTCQEPRGISAYLATGRDPKGAWAATVAMSTGNRVPACTESCRQLLSEFGIRDAARLDLRPAIFLNSSFFPDENSSNINAPLNGNN